MSNDVVKSGSNVLSLNFGSLSLEGLTPEQQNEIRALVAQKKFDLALDVATCKVKLDSSKADLDNVVGVAQRLDQTKAGYLIESEVETASGKTTISINRVRFSPFA